jgi:hypothetical protein
MRKSIKKSFIFFTLLIVIMLSSMLILPSMLFADSAIFMPTGGTNYGNWVTDGTVTVDFNVTGIDESKETVAKLRIWAESVDPLESFMVEFRGALEGILSSSENPTELDIGLEGIPIPNGVNTITIYITGYGRIYDGELEIYTGEPEEAVEEIVWIRDREMTCDHVWVNEDNKFQFSFIYPYRDNNWVKIYDMSGKEVYSVDMPYDNPNIIVDLPDGMYTVKTFNDQPEPIQTFVIGKP